MNFENMGWMLFMKSVGQIGTIKTHLVGSFREFILALNASLTILKSASETIPFIRENTPINSIMRRIDDVIALALAEANRHSSQNQEKDMEFRLKKQVLDSILEIIDDEIDGLKSSGAKNTRLKKQALESIKKAFLTHKNED